MKNQSSPNVSITTCHPPHPQVNEPTKHGGNEVERPLKSKQKFIFCFSKIAK